MYCCFVIACIRTSLPSYQTTLPQHTLLLIVIFSVTLMISLPSFPSPSLLFSSLPLASPFFPSLSPPFSLLPSPLFHFSYFSLFPSSLSTFQDLLDAQARGELSRDALASIAGFKVGHCNRLEKSLASLAANKL